MFGIKYVNERKMGFMMQIVHDGLAYERITTARDINHDLSYPYG